MNIDEVKFEHENLYENDLIYKCLVDNYAKSSIPDKKGNIDKEHYVSCLNALAIYKEKLHDQSRLNFIKCLNITNEELSDMLAKNILGIETWIKILKYKGYMR